MTLLLGPQTTTASRYNASHIRTRNTLERMFGVWKRLFPGLLMSRKQNFPQLLWQQQSCAFVGLHDLARPFENATRHALTIRYFT